MSHAVENDSTGTGKLLFKLTRDSDGIFYHTANAVTIAAHVFRAAICRHGSRENDSTGTGKLFFKLTRDGDGIFYHTANAATIAAHVFRAAICRHGSKGKCQHWHGEAVL